MGVCGVLWIWMCRGSNYFIRHQFHAKIIELEHSHFGNWEKCDFSRKSGKSTNFTLKIDFSVILNYMDLKIWTLFIRTLFYHCKKFQLKISKILYTAALQSCEVQNFSFSNCLNLNAYGLCCDCPIILKFCRMVDGSLRKFLMPSKVSYSKRKRTYGQLSELWKCLLLIFGYLGSWGS